MNKITQSISANSQNYFKKMVTVCCLFFAVGVAFGQLSITSNGTPFTQNFDGLSNTIGPNAQTGGIFDAGWSFLEAGGNANSTYDAGIGSVTTGNTYSFGVDGTNLPTDRAFGMLQSGSLTSILGFKFTNNTGATISSITIGYTGETWRLASAADHFAFSHQFGNVALNEDSGWTTVAALAFITPTTGSGLVDGNAATNRTVIAPVTIIGLSITNGTSYTLRWVDVSGSSSAGIGIDDFSITTNTAATTPILGIAGALAQGTSCTNTAATSITYTISNTGTAAATGISVTSSNPEFAVSSLSATSIAPNETATYVVTFTPTTTGAKTAIISVNSSNAATLTNTVSGTGINNAPSVATNTADNLQTTSARLRATTVVFGCPTTTVKGFVFATTTNNPDPLVGGTSVSNFPVTPLGLSQDFVSTQSGLITETQYSYKAYLFDGNTYTYGAVQTFTTLTILAPEPTVQPTNAVISNMTTTSMDLSWTVATAAPDGYIVTRRLGDVPTLALDGTFYTIGQAIDANTTVAFIGGALTAASTALQAGSQYVYRIYAYNGSGTNVNYLTAGALAISAYTLSLEPTAHPVTFTATAGTTSISLAFNAASTITNATGYLILRNTGSVPTGIPTDGLRYANNATIGDATVVTTITDSAATSFLVTGLTPGQTYFFTLIPFGKAGATAAFDGSSNYYTNPTIPSASAFLTNNSTTFIGVVGSEAATVSSIQNETVITTSTQGAKVWEFTIRDGGATFTDNDGLPTIITGLTILRPATSSVDFAGTILTAAIFDASGTLVATSGSLTATALVFSGLNINVPNNTAQTYSLRISLKTIGNEPAIIDGKDIGFSISNLNVTTRADATSSKIGTFTGVATPNNTNVIAVVASALRYVQNASNVNINSPMSPRVVVEATDANGNRDREFVSAITITSTGTLTAVAVVTATIGVATFPSIFHSAAGTGLVLTASAASFNALPSLPFDVILGPSLIAGWDFTGANNANAVSAAPSIVDPNLSTGILLTRGAGAAGSSGSNSFRTAGFSNNGIAVTNTDYFETQFKAKVGFTLSLESINARTTGTASFTVTPGVSMQFAYSLDNVNFTLIGASVFRIGEGSIPQITLSGVTALQNVASNTTITLRYYASGQTTTGGFGFHSPTSEALGLQFVGLLSCIPPAVFNVTSSGVTCNSATIGLSSSQLGINYRLRNNGADVGTILAGTDSAISFGNQTTVGSYTVAALNTNGTCSLSTIMTGAATITEGACATTWNGTAWSNGEPIAISDVIIAGNYTTTGNLNAKSITINSGIFTVATDHALTVANAINNNTGTTGFVVQNNGVVLQTTDAVNTGLAHVTRNSSNLYRQDYTLWSSPVSGQNLRAFSLQTLFNRFFSYDTAAGTNGAYVQELFTPADSNTKLFTTAKGYLIRMPNNWPVFVDTGTPGTPYAGVFTGTLNNGTIVIPLSTASTGYNLVGNPYPSPISISAFFVANANIENTLYFWRKRNGVLGSGFATTSQLGLVSAQSEVNGVSIGNTIKPGQGFFVRTIGSTSLAFNNGMRTNTSGTPFLRSANTTELHRFWLNLSDATNMVGQTLVGYTTGASQGIDDGIDATYFNDSPLALTSLIGENEYVIQGRSVPFVTTDVVPLGFKSDVVSSFTISLANFDGLFSGTQDIFLKDNLTGALQNLKLANYNFTSEIGIFNTRFEVQFNGILDTNNPVNVVNNIKIAVQNKVITINAGNVVLDKVELVDLTGRVVYSQKGINATTTSLANVLATNQMFIVRITTQSHGVVNQKVIY
jgi:hypothetical protein